MSVSDPNKNRELVIRFYNALPQQDYATLEALARPDYIQHNPMFETGIQGLINGLKQRPQRTPGDPPIPPLEFIRTVAEGDLYGRCAGCRFHRARHRERKKPTSMSFACRTEKSPSTGTTWRHFRGTG